MISIIIPTLNEESCIESTLRRLDNLHKEVQFEIIISDGGSKDLTKELARKYAAVINTPRGKALQLNKGAEAAQGEILFFMHADVFLPDGALREMERRIKDDKFEGGGFSNIFSTYNKKIKRLGRVLNLRIKNNDHPKNLIFYGDNGIFCLKSVFQQLGGFCEIPIMEDYDFSRRMRDGFRVTRIMEPRLIVSPRRHLRSGLIKTRLQWILVKRLYLMGVSPHFLARFYKDIR